MEYYCLTCSKGKNWTLLETVIKSKNLSQIKNYYYDHKKQFGKYQRDYGFQEETHNALPAQCVTTPNQNKVSPQAAELLDDGTPALAGRPDEESHLHLEKNCEPRNFVACGVKGHEGQASAPADFRSYLDCPVGTQGQEVASHYQDYGDRMLIDRSSARHFAEHESFSFSNLPPSVLHHHLLSEIQKAFPWLAPGQVAQVVAMQQQEQRPQHHHRQRSQELSFEPTSQSNVGSTSGAWASANG